MFDVRPLAQPETVTVPGGLITLTHTTERLIIDSRHPDVMELRTMKGFMTNGIFQDFGDHQVQTLDQTGFAEMLASTAGGKPAGVFRTTDIIPFIQARQAEIQAAKAAAQNPKP